MPTIDRDWLTRTLSELVAIDSRNPSLVPGAPGEAEIAELVADVLERIGLEASVHEPEPGRPSVVGRLAGTGGRGARSLMLNAHYDTVDVEGMERPFEPVVRDGRLYGRGAYDMKGSLAACLAAARALVDAGARLSGDLLIAAVADEEYASLGTADVLSRGAPDAAIVTEPTGLEICVAHRGFTWLEVETYGRAAHGSRFREGIDANLRMGRVLGRLEGLERELRGRAGHPLLGPPSLHAAVLAGGTGLSTYAERCTLKVERRTVPGETERQVRREVEAILEELREEDPETFRASLRVVLHREPFETRPDSTILAALWSVAAEVLGRAPETTGESPWMDSALLAAAGVDTVVFGPAGAGAHAAEEWVDLDSLGILAEVLARVAIAWCGAAFPPGSRGPRAPS